MLSKSIGPGNQMSPATFRDEMDLAIFERNIEIWAKRLNLQTEYLTNLFLESEYYRCRPSDIREITAIINAVTQTGDGETALKILHKCIPPRQTAKPNNPDEKRTGGKMNQKANRKRGKRQPKNEAVPAKNVGLNKTLFVIVVLVIALVVTLFVLSKTGSGPGNGAKNSNVVPYKTELLIFGSGILILYGYLYQTYQTYQLIDQIPVEMMGVNIRKPMLIVSIITGLLGTVLIVWDPFGLGASMAKEGSAGRISLLIAAVSLGVSYLTSMMDPGYPATSIALAGFIYWWKPIKNGPLMEVFNINPNSKLLPLFGTQGQDIDFSLVFYGLLMTGVLFYMLDAIRKENPSAKPGLISEIVKWLGAATILGFTITIGYFDENVYNAFAIVVAGAGMTGMNREEGDEWIMIPFLLGMSINLASGLFW